jgi:hypothetical protein
MTILDVWHEFSELDMLQFFGIRFSCPAQLFFWWAHPDLNREPTVYETAALTD